MQHTDLLCYFVRRASSTWLVSHDDHFRLHVRLQQAGHGKWNSETETGTPCIPLRHLTIKKSALHTIMRGIPSYKSDTIAFETVSITLSLKVVSAEREEKQSAGHGHALYGKNGLVVKRLYHVFYIAKHKQPPF